ncbi:MAG: ABC transporter permease [Chloroflexi bacterium]|nr:ABC transporter permease [Chloroflexota bacterium]
MKVFDIAIKDMLRSFRSAFALVFMFGIPLLMTGMFYLMFGNIAEGGEFSLPRTTVTIANLDEGGPRFQVSTRNIPGGVSARTMGDLIVTILQSEEMAELVEVSLVPSAQAARSAVDGQAAQVAIIIPTDFSRQFADPDEQAVIEFYQDPTLTIGPGIIRAIINRFMDGMAGVNIAVDVFLDEAPLAELTLAGQVVWHYMDISLVQTEDLADALLKVKLGESTVAPDSEADDTMLQRIVGSIMSGMMIFYAFFTGATTAQSILKEEEELTLPRLFTTPTPQVVILSGKFLAVFLTVLVQVVVLILVSWLIFNIQWGQPGLVALAAVGIVFIASTFGICINSFLKTTKQGGVIFGGVLTVTGMLGMISIFAMNSPAAARLGDTVSLLVPQGWAVRGISQVMNGASASTVGLTTLAMLVWSAAFFAIGVWRFNRRYV